MKVLIHDTMAGDTTVILKILGVFRRHDISRTVVGHQEKRLPGLNKERETSVSPSTEQHHANTGHYLAKPGHEHVSCSI